MANPSAHHTGYYEGLEVNHNDGSGAPIPTSELPPHHAGAYDGLGAPIPTSSEHSTPYGSGTLMAITDKLEHYGGTYQGSYYTDASPGIGGSPPEPPGYAHPPRPWWKRRLFQVGVCIFLLLIVVGAVVGGVLGSRQGGSASPLPTSSSKNDPVTSSGADTTATATGAAPIPTATGGPASIRPDSALAVSGWTTGSDYSVRLVYQGQDTKMRIVGYESASNKWGEPLVLQNASAKAGTTLGTSNIDERFYWNMTNTPTGWQTEVFFQGEDDVFTEWTVRDSTSINVVGSSSDLAISLAPSSKIVSFWPSVVYESSSGLVTETWLPKSVWQFATVPIEIDHGSYMAQVPAQANFPVGGTNLFMRKKDGTLGQITGNSTIGWKAGSLKQDIPAGTTIAAFVQLKKQTAPKLDTYVLYQDDKDIIQVMYQDDDSGWKGPEAAAGFEKADKATPLVCLTPMATQGTAVTKDYTQASRCYFRSGGMVKEVLFDGDKWQTGVTVTLPT